MKKFLSTFLLLAFLFTLTECAKKGVAKKPLPPGQAKKLFGTKSAAPFAPGQNKKQTTPAKSQGSGKKKN
jgi:predicted small lipoprotein YifL